MLEGFQVSEMLLCGIDVVGCEVVVLVKPFEKLVSITTEQLLTLKIGPVRFIVDKLLSTGVNMLAGRSKIGKSRLALWLCHQVSRGEPVWGYQTQECDVLYLALEDNDKRMLLRFTALAEAGSPRCHIVFKSITIFGTLMLRLQDFIDDYPETGLIVIDTLQYVREGDKGGYAGDYETIKILKAFADEHDISILIILHQRKEDDSDPLNTVTGTTGITGAADNVYVLTKESRLSKSGSLFVIGRDVEGMILNLEYDNTTNVWEFVSFSDNENEKVPSRAEMLVEAVGAFVSDRGMFIGTPTELATKLEDYGVSINPKSISRMIDEQEAALKERHGSVVEYERTKSARLIRLIVMNE
jgi:hypothetical protein